MKLVRPENRTCFFLFFIQFEVRDHSLHSVRYWLNIKGNIFEIVRVQRARE